MDEPYWSRFLETLQHGVGLVVVLRGHLYVEAAIETLILARAPGFEPYLGSPRFSFARKVDVATALGVLTPECAKGVQALNKIRNDFAHDLKREDLTKAEDGRMKGALSARLAAKARECVAFDPDRVVGGWARAGIAAIHNDLQHAYIALLVEQNRRARGVSPNET